MNTTHNVLIIGAGLTGLTAAYHLTQQGIEAKIVEARSRIGGRTLTASMPDGRGRFDLGAAWYWSDHTHIQELAETLGVETYPQYETGRAVFDRGPNLPVQYFQPPYDQPLAHRFVGGSQELAHRLAAKLPAHTIELDVIVSKICQVDSNLVVFATKSEGEKLVYRTKYVVVTLPPRSAAGAIDYSPPLSEDLKQAMQETYTWMGQAMKAFLIYESPFWRQQGLSGFGISHLGPINQFHDATPAGGQAAALFGWLGDHSFGRSMSPARRRAAVVAQATRMFGKQAGEPLHYVELNWAEEPFTTLTPSSNFPPQEHPPYGHRLLQRPIMDGQLFWAGAETSPVNGGYLDGAVYSGQTIAQRILNVIRS